MTLDPVEARPAHVLIANDQEWSARSLESILVPQGFEVVRAYTGSQALETARRVIPDVIILDAQMPDLAGVEVCRELRTDPRFDATTPILITTAGPSGRAQRLEAFAAGAWAFHAQPFDGEVLLAELQTFLACKRAVDLLRQQAVLDEQTGLYNLRGVTRRARELGSDAHRHHTALACVVMSPELPSTEDSGPHQRAIVDLLVRLFRESGRAADAIGRIGRAEFAVVAAGTGPEGAVQLARRFDTLLQENVARAGVVADSSARLRAGYCAVPDFAKSGMDAVEMLSRATGALAVAAPEERIRAA